MRDARSRGGACLLHALPQRRLLARGRAHRRALLRDRHSTEIALYTFASEEDNAPVRRIAALDLPEALAAESTATLPRLFPRGRVLPPDSGGARPLSAYAPLCGLRAPPVSA